MEAFALIEALRAAGYKPVPYSGRGMEGRECVGLHVESVGDLVPLGAALAALQPTAPTTDGGGRGMLAVYWQNVPWPRYDPEKASDAVIDAVIVAAIDAVIVAAKIAVHRDVIAATDNTARDWDLAHEADEKLDQARDQLLALLRKP